MQAKNKNLTSQAATCERLEVNAEYFGMSLLQLMENAGRNVAEEIISRFPKEQESRRFLRFRRKRRRRFRCC